MYGTFTQHFDVSFFFFSFLAAPNFGFCALRSLARTVDHWRVVDDDDSESTQYYRVQQTINTICKSIKKPSAIMIPFAVRAAVLLIRIKYLLIRREIGVRCARPTIKAKSVSVHISASFVVRNSNIYSSGTTLFDDARCCRVRWVRLPSSPPLQTYSTILSHGS